MKKWGLRLAWALASLELLYILATILLLNLPSGVRSVLEKDAAFQARYAFAFSLFPGRIQIWDLRMHVQTPTEKMVFYSSRLGFTVDLPALARHHFRASTVHLRDLRFHMRIVTGKARKNVAAVNHPPLPRFPKLETGGTPGPVWRISLNDVFISQAQEIWVNEYRFEGDSSLRGVLDMQTQGASLSLPDTRWQIRSGSIHRGTETLVQNWRGDTVFVLAPFEPKTLKGNSFMRFADATIQNQAEIGSLEFLNYYTRHMPSIAFARGRGRLESKLVIKAGVLQSTSTLGVDASELEMRFWKQTLTGEGQIKGYFADGKPVLDGTVRTYNLRFSKEKEGIEGRDLRLTLKSRRLDFAEHLEPVYAHLRVPPAILKDLASLNSFLPRASAVHLVKGSAEFEADLYANSAKGHSDRGTIRVEADKATLSVKGKELTGSLALDTRIAQSKIDHGLLQVSGTRLELKRVAFDTTKDWWLRVNLDRANWDMKSGINIKADVRIRARDLRPVVDLYLLAKNDPVPGFIRGLLDFNDFSARTRIAVDDNYLLVTGFRAESDTSRLVGRFEEKEGVREGRLLLEVGPLAAGLDIQGGAVSLKLNDAYAWFATPPLFPIH